MLGSGGFVESERKRCWYHDLRKKALFVEMGFVNRMQLKPLIEIQACDISASCHRSDQG
jgi:hypothetical protein